MFCCFRIKKYRCNYCNIEFNSKRDRNLHQLQCLQRPLYFPT